MEIIVPEAGDLIACFELEEHYAFDSETASADGFFLPGASLSLYETLLASGYMRVIMKDGRMQAFLAALPPRHEILERLMKNSAAFVLQDRQANVTPDNTVWIAKIAAAPDAKRTGLATRLYNRLFEDFRNLNIMTATAFEPVRNIPSEKFHQSIGMVECGIYYGINKNTGAATANTIWKYEP